MPTEAQKRPEIEARGIPFSRFFDFLFFFRPFREAKNPKLAIFAIFERIFLQENLQCEKKRKQKRNPAQVGAMRGAGGRGGRVALACITLRVFARVCAGVCMQAFVRHLSRRQGCGGFKRSAHSAVPTLVAWMLGGLVKISPKWSPRQPQMEPELRKNRAKIPKNAVWHLKCSQVGSSRDHNQRAWPQIIDFWVHLGTPNRPKIDQWTYKVRQVLFFKRFL